MRAVDRVAVEITALAQRGSLPYYLGTIALVLVLFPGWSLVQAGTRVDRIAWFDNPAQPVVGALVIAAAVLAGRARGRVKAILLVGVTGYGTAFLFLLHGAPDLALTQVLVETVTLVVLALVLRRLGPYFSDRPLLRSRWWRLVLAVGAGAVASAAALLALGHRTAVPVSVAYDEEAYRFGYGKNIVNVTLVDTRAWDTLGEISVLMVAATGVASLIFVVTRSPRLHRAASEQLPGGRVERPAAGPGGTDGVRLTWLRGQRSLSPFSRSIVFAVMVRLLFPIMILCSLYLLFTGHNAPGGGFAAGLITGLAIMVRYLAGGSAELAEAAPVDAGRVLGAGLLVSTLSAVAPTLFGGRILQSYAIDLHLGALSRLHTAWGEVDILGDVHLVTSLFFDVGVYLVVVGVLLDLVRSLGAGVDLTASGRPAPATTAAATGAAATGAAATGAEATGGAGR
jgi:multicomponent Na+:H+ antiporter subunit A